VSFASLVGGYVVGMMIVAFLAGAAIEQASDPNVRLAVGLVIAWPLTVPLILGMMWWGGDT
jgi:biotin transporter BioY